MGSFMKNFSNLVGKLERKIERSSFHLVKNLWNLLRNDRKKSIDIWFRHRIERNRYRRLKDPAYTKSSKIQLFWEVEWSHSFERLQYPVLHFLPFLLISLTRRSCFCFEALSVVGDLAERWIICGAKCRDADMANIISG